MGRVHGRRSTLPVNTARPCGPWTRVVGTEQPYPRAVYDKDIIIIFYLQNAWDSTDYQHGPWTRIMCTKPRSNVSTRPRRQNTRNIRSYKLLTKIMFQSYRIDHHHKGCYSPQINTAINACILTIENRVTNSWLDSTLAKIVDRVT